MTDLLLIENGTGGDLILRGNDMASVNGVENTPYLSMFGGSSWWGNFLDTSNQFLCKTEAVLKVTPLTSSGRIAIENAIRSDLSYLSNIQGTKYAVSTSITNVNRLAITITINGQLFNLEWNPDTLFLNYNLK